MVADGARKVFLMSVVPVSFGLICPWFRTAWQQFLHKPALARGPVFADPCSKEYTM